MFSTNVSFSSSVTNNSSLNASGYSYMANNSTASRYESVSIVCPFYASPPTKFIDLDDFESRAADRLKVMHGFEDAQSRLTSPDQLKDYFEKSIRSSHLYLRTREEIMRMKREELIELAESYRVDEELSLDLDEQDSSRDLIISKIVEKQMEHDNLSHWVLRLAFCSTEELRRRFLSFEVYLFKFRFQSLQKEKIASFILENNLGYESISDNEKSDYFPQLEAVMKASNYFKELKINNGFTSVNSSDALKMTKYYKVYFTEVTDLVARRQVFLSKGYAYVPQHDLISILAARFRATISKKMVNAAKMLPTIQDERVVGMIGKLQNAYLGPNYTKRGEIAGGNVTPEMIAPLSQESFPMCMRELQRVLATDHHLKYDGRLQFTLFLKGIGLTVEDCLRYFQTEFTKGGINADDFRKKYAYNIRHSYGLEGKRADYAPHSCAKIINAPNPAAGQCHGCPYKTYSTENMRKSLMRQRGLHSSEINEIVKIMQDKEYQRACRKHFEYSHRNASVEQVGNHPNAWFDESIKYHEKQKGSQASTTSETDKQESTAEDMDLPTNKSDDA